MGSDKRKFIISELMEPGFIVNKNQKILLRELEESGKSELEVFLMSDDNLCIENVDKKKTDILFFQNEKAKSMYKRVDHIIFGRQQDNRWKLYLIEMKGSVGEKKWVEVKGKFRASYLLAQALAGMLELEISEVSMYTTFERVEFKPSETIPTARRKSLGERLVRMEDEWNGVHFGLNFGEYIPFMHIPIQMERNQHGILVGNLKE